MPAIRFRCFYLHNRAQPYRGQATLPQGSTEPAGPGGRGVSVEAAEGCESVAAFAAFGSSYLNSRSANHPAVDPPTCFVSIPRSFRRSPNLWERCLPAIMFRCFYLHNRVQPYRRQATLPQGSTEPVGPAGRGFYVGAAEGCESVAAFAAFGSSYLNSRSANHPAVDLDLRAFDFDLGAPSNHAGRNSILIRRCKPAWMPV